MKRTFTTTFVGIAAAVALAAIGCKKENKDQASGAGGATGGAAALPSKTGFAVFPATAKAVGALNLDSARSSVLWAMYKDSIESAVSKEMAEFKSSCGFDPLAQLKSVAIGTDPSTDQTVVVAKGVSRDQFKGCGEKLAAKEGKKLAVQDEGNLSHYQVDDKQAWAAWVDDTTVVFSANRDKDYVSKRAGGEAGLQDGAEVMSLLKKVDTNATFYVAATSDVMAENPAAGMMPSGAKGVFVSLKLGEGLDMDAGARFDTPENAKNFTTMLEGQLNSVKGQQMPPEMSGLAKAIEKAVIKQDGNDSLMQLKLTSEELKQLGTVLQQMGQAFGLMGHGGSSSNPM